MVTLQLGSHVHRNALYLANACLASYSGNPRATAAYKTTDLGKPILFGDDDDDEAGDAGFVAESSSSVVVAIRGTDDLEDWLRNLKFGMVSDLDGEVHAGFRHGMHNVFDRVVAAIKEIDQPNKRLYITGHSRGGALAVLLAKKMFNDFSATERLLVPDFVFTFGAPRVGDLDFYRNYQLRKKSKLYINESDPVPLIPPVGSDYVHVEQQFLLTDGSIKVVDLDTFSDGVLHPIRVGFPDPRDHNLKNGYIANLQSNI